MRTSSRMFWILALFFLIVTVAYGLITGFRSPTGIEMVGFPAFIMATLLAALLALTTQITAKKHAGQPEDNEDGEVSDQAGVQGSFAPYSWWPLWTALGCAFAFLGVAAGWWILYIGLVPVIVGVVGWVMEFSRKEHAH
ncbi:cytochrome c oxidase subunit 4 [Brachybacterium hainanense]|uniref:Cytochrome c oxidase polypeptide 4 n=1 Tax=Brachybacterium hainanense TaxID=1541174 RepID=A0ABV6REE3_9MICO